MGYSMAQFRAWHRAGVSNVTWEARITMLPAGKKNMPSFSNVMPLAPNSRLAEDSRLLWWH